MRETIYVVDDEKNTRELIAAFLKREDYRVQTFADGASLLAACEEAVPDLVILDILMPGMDGLSVCSSLRHSYETLPIIIVSAKDSPYDRVTGLTLGCDDYMVKPFLPLELAMRVRALLRRRSVQAAAPEGSAELVYGPLTLYPERRSATLAGEAFPLTPTEYDFLAFLIRRAGAAVSREELLKSLWQVDWEADTRATDDLVKRLRRKLRERNSPVKIETVWGFGFRLTLDGENT